MKGPVHTFNGVQANFYISTGHGSCSKKGNARDDADYFCKSFYGDGFKSTSHIHGLYSASGKMGWQMHHGDPKGCTSAGDSIKNTYCEDGECKILETDSNKFGLYDIVCKGNIHT